ncbi:MAG: hypothetical protein ACE5I9_13415 [Candidatus Methylomirabilales bacterium]
MSTGRKSRLKKVKVFILYEHTLFGLGLERLLKQARGIEVVGTAARSEKSVDQLRTLRPHVIIVEGGDPSLGSGLWEVLKEGLPGRVISIPLDEDRATVYTTRQVLVAEVEELVKVVRSGGRPGSACHP